jgi:hypothetical protein
MRRLGLLFGLGATLFLAGCACNPDPVGTQAVSLRAQETSMWCWAASGEMCMDFLGTDVTQCDQANKRFNRTDCCTNPGNCVTGGWPEFQKYNFTFQRTSNTALTFAQLKEQIFCKKKPVAFSWHWPGGGGHMMVVYGYSDAGGQQWVYYRDPWPPNTGNGTAAIPYAQWVTDPGRHTHWDDFYDITKQ